MHSNVISNPIENSFPMSFCSLRKLTEILFHISFFCYLRKQIFFILNEGVESYPND